MSMEHYLSAEELAFRDEVRAFIKANLPPELADGSHQSDGAPDCADGRIEDYLFRRAATIYAGSSETQRNILAKSIFGH